MPYSLYHCGQLVGHTDLAHEGPMPDQRLGVVKPTPRGVTVLPALVGVLSVSLALQDIVPENEGDKVDDEAVRNALTHSQAGRRAIRLVLQLQRLELRDDAGRRLDFKTISISNLEELTKISKEHGIDFQPVSLTSAPDLFLVSVTFGARRALVAEPRRTAPRFRPRWRRPA